MLTFRILLQTNFAFRLLLITLFTPTPFLLASLVYPVAPLLALALPLILICFDGVPLVVSLSSPYLVCVAMSFLYAW
jgi:hypothetical protein